jgi:hypothetical protein
MAKGISADATEWIIADLTRRLDAVQTNFRPPPELGEDHAFNWLHQAVGAILAVLVTLELELWGIESLTPLRCRLRGPED